MRTLILGCGFLGKRVAHRWLAAGHRVSCLTRSLARADEFRRLGIDPVVGDLVDPDLASRLPEVDIVLHAVGFDRTGPHTKRAVYVDGLAQSLASPAGRSPRWISISSTSVYGQSDGSFVDEESVTDPTTEGGQICLAAEKLLAAWTERTGGIGVVLRLSGLYGPGRLLARIEQLRSQTPMTGRPDAWLNLIHGDDAATLACHLAEHPSPPPMVLGSDDRPIQRIEYYTRLANLAGAPPPLFPGNPQETDLNKRCSNRLARELGWNPQYPTIEEGLTQSWAEHVS